MNKKRRRRRRRRRIKGRASSNLEAWRKVNVKMVKPPWTLRDETSRRREEGRKIKTGPHEISIT